MRLKPNSISDGFYHLTRSALLLSLLMSILAACSSLGNQSQLQSQSQDNSNSTPTLLSQSFATDEDIPLSEVLVGQDSDGDAFRLEIVVGPSHGEIQLDPLSGSFTYTPRNNFFGSDEIQITLDDGKEKSQAYPIRFEVLPIDDPVQISDVNMTINEDQIVDTQLAVNDFGEGDARLALSVLPSHGVASLSPSGHLVYSPQPNFSGVDSMRVVAIDEPFIPSAATITIQVNATDDPPVGQGADFSFPEDTVGSGRLQATDIDSMDIQFEIITQPGHGAINLNSLTGDFTFTPEADFSGNLSFVWRPIADGLPGAPITSSIVVTPVNDPPVVPNQDFSTPEDNILSRNLLGSDVDSPNLVYTKIEDPLHGQLILEPTGHFTYTPNADYFGPDSFRVKASDENSESNPAQVSISVTAVDDAPVGVAVNFTFVEDQVSNGQISATDIDSTNIDYEIVSQPSSGTINLNADTGNFTYTPLTNFVGNTSFSWRPIADAQAGSTFISTITVTNVNDAPVVPNQSFSTPEDTPLTASVSGNDVDGDSLFFIQVQAPAHGQLNLQANGNFTYTPNADYFGMDSFRVQANDGQANSNTATITIQISPVDDAPIANDLSFLALSGVTYNGSLNGSDVDNSSTNFQFLQVSPPSHGVLTINSSSGAFAYTASATYEGLDSFRFKIRSNGRDSNIATAQITVTQNIGAPDFVIYFEIEPGQAINTIGAKVQDVGYLEETTPDSNTYQRYAHIGEGVHSLILGANMGFGAVGTPANTANLIYSPTSVLVSPSKGSVSAQGNGFFSYTAPPGVSGVDEFVTDTTLPPNFMAGLLSNDDGSWVQDADGSFPVGIFESLRVRYIIKFCDPAVDCPNDGAIIQHNFGLWINGPLRLFGLTALSGHLYLQDLITGIQDPRFGVLGSEDLFWTQSPAGIGLGAGIIDVSGNITVGGSLLNFASPPQFVYLAALLDDLGLNN